MKTFKKIFSFFIGPTSTKTIKYQQFRCNFEDKMDKQTIIMDFLQN